MNAWLTILLATTPADPDALQGAWRSAAGVRLTIAGEQVAVSGGDGYGDFAGRLTLTPTRLRIVGHGWAVERRWRLSGGRLWLGGVEYRRLLFP